LLAHAASSDSSAAGQLHEEVQILKAVDIPDQAVMRLEVEAFAKDV